MDLDNSGVALAVGLVGGGLITIIVAWGFALMTRNDLLNLEGRINTAQTKLEAALAELVDKTAEEIPQRVVDSLTAEKLAEAGKRLGAIVPTSLAMQVLSKALTARLAATEKASPNDAAADVSAASLPEAVAPRPKDPDAQVD